MTKIEWCDETINPIAGCTKISAGCKNCYAEKMAWRLKSMGVPKYQDVVDKNGWTGKIGVDMSVFNKLPKTPKKIFINSMGDLFNEKIPEDFIHDIYNVIYDNPHHTFLVLTKRIDRLFYFHSKSMFLSNDPISNLWLGVSVEDEDNLYRVEKLLELPSVVRFVSAEPMLERIDMSHHMNQWWDNGEGENSYFFKGGRLLSWVIAGPETGSKARSCPPGAIENLYEQCKAAGVPFFDKRKDFIAREFPR